MMKIYVLTKVKSTQGHCNYNTIGVYSDFETAKRDLHWEVSKAMTKYCLPTDQGDKGYDTWEKDDRINWGYMDDDKTDWVYEEVDRWYDLHIYITGHKLI